MKQKQFIRVLAVTLIMALVAAACGGGSDTPIESSEGADAAQDAAPNFGGVDDNAPANDASIAPIPTTAPLTIEAEAAALDEVEPEAIENIDLEAENPWDVTVLHVNDDVAIVPTFDGPNGNEMPLVDINEIDGVRTPYPLLAQTHFGNRLALLVDEFDSSGNWAKVFVPIRPNGTTAWVQTAFFHQETHDYHIEISLSQNKVNVFQGDQLLVEQIAVIGRETRPTPVLRSYIDEKIDGTTLSPAYGDWILSIAAYSEALGTFGGGLPKLALHGTDSPALMGQAVSSGCVRVPNEVISFIAESVPVGTIVDIVA